MGCRQAFWFCGECGTGEVEFGSEGRKIPNANRFSEWPIPSDSQKHKSLLRGVSSNN